MDIFSAGLFYEALNYYEETFFSNDKDVFDIIPTMDMIKEFEKFEKKLHRFNRRMRTKRRKCKSFYVVGDSKI